MLRSVGASKRTIVVAQRSRTALVAARNAVCSRPASARSVGHGIVRSPGAVEGVSGKCARSATPSRRTMLQNSAVRALGSGGQLRRGFHSSSLRRHGEYEKQDPKSPEEVVIVNVTARDGTKHVVKGKVGDNLLYLCHRFQEANPALFLEGACEASLACSTCHVIVSEKFFDKLPETLEKEDDMLDSAACLTATSRLGCQIVLSKELDGLEVTLPPYSRNMYVDGHKPTPH